MGFHRTVMRNYARRIGGNGNMYAVWPDVRAWKWRARGCRAVVRTAKNKSRPRLASPMAAAARPGFRQQRGLRAMYHRLLHAIADQTMAMSVYRAQKHGM